MVDSGVRRTRQAAVARIRIPTDRQIRALHERYAPSRDAFDLVYTHCEIVCRVAEHLIARQEIAINIELVRAGCLLHDIGVYRLYLPSGDIDSANYGRHGLLGDLTLAQLGFPDVLRRFCSRHTGVGLSRADVRHQRLRLPDGDYLAESTEELLVMYADKHHSKTSPPSFVSVASYGSSLRRFGEDKVARFTSMVELFGEPDLTPLMREYGHALA
jgi:uncharacterized protein